MAKQRPIVEKYNWFKFRSLVSVPLYKLANPSTETILVEGKLKVVQLFDSHVCLSHLRLCIVGFTWYSVNGSVNQPAIVKTATARQTTHLADTVVLGKSKLFTSKQFYLRIAITPVYYFDVADFLPCVLSSLLNNPRQTSSDIPQMYVSSCVLSTPHWSALRPLRLSYNFKSKGAILVAY